MTRLSRVLVDAAAVVAAWGVLLLAENIALGFLWREHFAGAWEISLARHTAVPLAFAGLAPMSLVVTGCWNAAQRAAQGARPAGHVLGAIGAIATGAMAIGISGGRHFHEWAVRAAFVVTLGALGWLLGAHLVPRATRLARSPVLLAVLGLAIAVGAWVTDGYVLYRLYPAFHAAMLVASLLGAGLIGIAFRAGSAPTIGAGASAAVVALIVAACALWTPHALRLLDGATNVRVALVEHGPVLGRAVILEERLRHAGSEPDPQPGVAAAPFAPGEVVRALDWTAHDLVLLSVDALRADHVSAYGYARATTPNIDALARDGVLFERAYCPTPHTSYSVTSMLTGKYMRPLLALGLGEDSETWPQALRRYAWRTAAFYPPAIFFIDEERFTRFEQEHLGFEYAKAEFADPLLREKQVAEYLASAAGDMPLFLWIHFFEPHEPYVPHPDHLFGGGVSPDVDAYDSEIAAADEGIGRVVRLVRDRRPGAIVIVTADHGEEFGEHGGRYHGTTVYEEQVRVPLVIAGPGVRKGLRVESVTQTIDLLPTVLSALGIPRPARIRGRDLGPLLGGDQPTQDSGFALAETDDYALVASGEERLVCERRAAACALYRPRLDPYEHHDLGRDDPARLDALRALLRSVERDHGRYEASAGPVWPEALRRGMQGDADAALDVASLLDDADVAIRRKAAEVCFRLRATAAGSALQRAVARDEDIEVQRWSALALVRMGEPASPVADALLKDASREWRRRAALTAAERGDDRACEEIAGWWGDVVPAQWRESADGEPPRLAIELARAEELLAATAKARCRAAVPALVRALDDVRARPYVADALGAIGDDRARARLLALFATERYVTARPREARALLALGARDWSAPAPEAEARAILRVPAHGDAFRLLVLMSAKDASLEVHGDGLALENSPTGTEVRALELSALGRHQIQLDMRASSGAIIAAWLVPAGPLD
jgi:arylsulfatase A-like enzyme